MRVEVPSTDPPARAGFRVPLTRAAGEVIRAGGLELKAGPVDVGRVLTHQAAPGPLRRATK